MINEAPGLPSDQSDQLFEIFHYKVSAWTSNVVDAWAETNEIVIKMPKRVASLQRQPNNDFYRGSFGPIVNSARMESVKKIMRNMYSGQGWKITIAKNQQAASNDLYTSKTWVKNRYQKYYIVEKSFSDADEALGEVCFVFELSVFVIKLILTFHTLIFAKFLCSLW